MEGKVSNIKSNNMMEYLIDTAAGQSGSGIWYEENGNFYIVGVHAQGCQIVNEGVLFTKEHYGEIYKWIDEGMKEEIEKKPRNYILSMDLIQGVINRPQIDILLDSEFIHLREFWVYAIGVETLANNTTWTHLQEIRLWGNNIGDIGAEALAKNTTWIHPSEIKSFWKPNISLNHEKEEESDDQIESDILATSDNFFYRNDESSCFPLEIFQAKPVNEDFTYTTFQKLSLNTKNNCDFEFPSLPVESVTSNGLEHSPR